MLDNAFSSRPDFDVVGHAYDAVSAAEIIRNVLPDIVTIDLCMPYVDGEQLLAMIDDLKGICKIIFSDRPISNLLLASKLYDAGAFACVGKKELVEDKAGFFNKVNSIADNFSRFKMLEPVADNRTKTAAQKQSAHAAPMNGAPLHYATKRPVFAFPIPADERARLKYIHQQDLANSNPERQFDLVTKHVAMTTDFPCCLLTVIDENTQWVKSTFGLDIKSTPRHQAFCNYTISQDGIFAVSNAQADTRFEFHDLVTGAPNIRSYVGHPVINSQGVTIGALCLIDMKVRIVTEHITDQLVGMAEVVSEMINQREALTD